MTSGTKQSSATAEQSQREERTGESELPGLMVRYQQGEAVAVRKAFEQARETAGVLRAHLLATDRHLRRRSHQDLPGFPQLGVTVLQFTCVLQDIGHLLVWHGGVLVISTLAGWLVGRSVSSLDARLG